MAGPSCLSSSPLLTVTCSYMVVSLLHMSEAFMASPQAFKTSTEGNTMFMVPLDMQHVPVVSGGRQVAVKTAYYGKIFVGGPRPQNFSVIFDTGSGHLILPSAECTEEACMLHHRYDHAASNSSTQIDHNGAVASADLQPSERDRVSIGYGTGDVEGDIVRDTVCLGMSSAAPRAEEGGAVSLKNMDASINYADNAPANCASVRVITALQMSTEPFSSFNFDGVLGLGLSSLALDPEYHFFGQLAKRMQIAPLFSFFLSNSDDVRSEITFGGHDPKRMVGGPEAVQFLPVERPQDGFWRVQIQGVRVGSRTLPLCDNGACTAIVDTGTSTIAIPPEASEDLFAMTTRQLSKYIPSFDDARTQIPENQWPDCRHMGSSGRRHKGTSNVMQVPGPPLIFDMGDFEIILQAKEYSRPGPIDVDDLEEDGSNATRTVCRASLLPVDLPPLGKRVFIWGKPVLQKYYSTFDVKGERIGFVTAVQSSSE